MKSVKFALVVHWILVAHLLTKAASDINGFSVFSLFAWFLNTMEESYTTGARAHRQPWPWNLELWKNKRTQWVSCRKPSNSESGIQTDILGDRCLMHLTVPNINANVREFHGQVRRWLVYDLVLSPSTSHQHSQTVIITIVMFASLTYCGSLSLLPLQASGLLATIHSVRLSLTPINLESVYSGFGCYFTACFKDYGAHFYYIHELLI